MFDPRQVHVRSAVCIVTVGNVLLFVLIYRLLLPFLPFIDAHSSSLSETRAGGTWEHPNKEILLGISENIRQKRSSISCSLPYKFCGPGQLRRYSNWLLVGRSGDRIPDGTTFSAPVKTDPRAHPASCTMGTGFFPG